MEPAQSVEIPPLRGAPMTRSRTKSLKGFTKAVDLFLDKDHSDADRAHADITKDNADPRVFPFTTNDREASTSDVGAETSHEIPQNASYSHTTEWPLMRTKKQTSLFVLSLA